MRPARAVTVADVARGIPLDRENLDPITRKPLPVSMAHVAAARYRREIERGFGLQRLSVADVLSLCQTPWGIESVLRESLATATADARTRLRWRRIARCRLAELRGEMLAPSEVETPVLPWDRPAPVWAGSTVRVGRLHQPWELAP